MSSSSGPAQPQSGDRHGWNSLDRYLAIHDHHLRVREHFIEDDGLRIWVAAPDRILVEGRLMCSNGLFIDVHKILELNDRGQIRTIQYSYHAGVMGDEDRTIFRYDNAHPYTREGHADEHHKHRYN